MVPPSYMHHHRQTMVEDYTDQIPLQTQSHSGDGQVHQVSSSQGNQDVATRGVMINSGECIFEEGHVDFSMDQYQIGNSSNQFNNRDSLGQSDVANPYAAAKRRLFM